jgi:hypothetical protein
LRYKTRGEIAAAPHATGNDTNGLVRIILAMHPASIHGDSGNERDADEQT